MATVENALQIVQQMPPALSFLDRSIQQTTSRINQLQAIAGNSLAFPGIQMWQSSLNRTATGYEEVIDVIEVTNEQQERLEEGTENNTKKVAKLKDLWEKVSSVMGSIGIATSPMEIFQNANSIKAAGNVIQAQTGMQGTDLDAAKDSSKNLYVGNLSSSPEEAAKSLAMVNQLTGQTGNKLEQVTRASLLLQDSFGYELPQSIKSASMLQQQFGVTGAEAFDLIVQGTQAGLNKNGELLDSINQYSSNFKSLGLGGEEMFQAFVNGAQNGGISVNSLGEAVNEFSKRAVSGSQEANQGFSSLGLDAGKMTESFQAGGDTAKQAFSQTIAALSRMEDPVAKNMAGVQLFGDAWGEIGSNGVKALSELDGSVELTSENLESLNQLKYNDASSALSSLTKTINMGLAGPMSNLVNNVTNIINAFTTGLQGNVGEINGLFGMLGYGVGIVGGFISDNWSIIEPILFGIIAALTIKKACEVAGATATMFMKKAQEGFNLSLKACPAMWIVMIIMVLIGVFYACVAAINKFSGTSYSATGIICGAFATVLAFVKNTLMALVEVLFGIVEFLVSPWIAFANFFGNLFNDPIGSVVHLFADLGDSVLKIIQKIAKGFDMIAGTKFEDKVKDMRDGLSKVADEFAKEHGNGTYEVKADDLDLDEIAAKFGYDPKRSGYKDTFESTYDDTKNLTSGFGDMFNGTDDLFNPQEDPFNSQNDPLLNGDSDITKYTGDTAMNTAAMSESMDGLDEELKYMRDAAEQEIINRFTLAELKIDVNNQNTLKNVTDIDEMNRRLGDVTGEVLASYAEGVI